MLVNVKNFKTEGETQSRQDAKGNAHLAFFFFSFFASLVRQAKLDVSYQLKGTDHGNYSFAM